ncbi:MAG: aminotransferase class IV [Ferruginibacter sp.]
MSYFNYNGHLFKEGTAIIGGSNRGLRYGDGLFETIKVKNDAILFEAAHFSRLWNGMRVLEFDFPAYFTKDILKEQIMQLAKKNNVERSARIRLSVFRGDGNLYDPVNNDPDYIIQALPLAADAGEWNINGLVTGIFREVKKNGDILSSLKHNNYLPSIMAARHAKKMKWDDTILLNSFGRIAETSIANIFIVRGEMISTPHLKEGCVAGIMRQALITYLQENNWKISEREITEQDLLVADEVFITNSIRNIKWVRQIGERVYTNIITQQIYNSFIPTIS